MDVKLPIRVKLKVSAIISRACFNLPTVNIAKTGAPVIGFRYNNEETNTFHSLLASCMIPLYKDGMISVNAIHPTNIVHVAIMGLAQSTSRTSKTLTSGMAVPASSL